jgi:hypothetical protein
MTAAMIVRRSGSEPAPLSAAQSRAWLLQRMDPGHAPFNRPLAVRLKGPFDCTALSRSVGEILRRHEILHHRRAAKHRTRFRGDAASEEALMNVDRR